MTGPQLHKWRTDHDLTLRDLVTDYLKDEVTHVTASRWERSNDDIPKWAADMILGKTVVKLPLDELHQLLDIAREDNRPAEELFAIAIREYLQRRTSNSHQTEIRESTIQAGGKELKLFSPAADVHQTRAAEDPPPATAPTMEDHLQEAARMFVAKNPLPGSTAPTARGSAPAPQGTDAPPRKR